MNEKITNKINLLSKVISSVMIIAIILFLVLYNFPHERTQESKAMKTTTIKFQKDGELTFQSSTGTYISKINVEFAEDDDKRTRGLMDRLSMEENQGMLFIFPYESMQSFWMKNTVIPLDIIFVDRNNEIVTIHKDTEPFYTGQYKSTKPASQVVEVNAGYTDLYNINVGDKIIWRRN